MALSFLSKQFPANDITDGQYLYRTLGSFWTQIFTDKNALKGYTLGTAEELIQAYYKLIEVIRQYSVKDIDLYSKEKWLPLVVKKSEFNSVPFIFEAGGAVFGKQPEADKYYADEVFRFGFPKQSSSGNFFGVALDRKVAQAGVIANRVIAPSVLLIPGADFKLDKEALYFNSNIFEDKRWQKTKLLGEFGIPVTYTDRAGRLQEDEFVVLWVYQAAVDEDALYNNFGVLLDIREPTSQSYKELLKAFMNLAVEGPTIVALKLIFSAIAQSPIVIENFEIVEQMYSDDYGQYVITDSHVYKIPLRHKISDKVTEGAELAAGEVISGDFKFVDTVISANWWNTEIPSNKISLAPYVFAANVSNQLFFENTVELIKFIDSKIIFPVKGRTKDVKAFHDYINDASRQQALLSKLGLTAEKNAMAINPVEFVFENFLKNNTALLVLDFSSETQLIKFFKLLPTIQPYLPPYAYILLYVNFKIDTDVLGKLNSAVTIPGFDSQLFSSDGSDRITGSRPEKSGEDPDYYKDYINRLFCISVGPYRNPTNILGDDRPLHDDLNLDTLNADNTLTKGSTAPGIRAGTIRTDIPLEIVETGTDVARAPSTKEVQSILLIDF